jgi:hypothetical protein
MFLQGRRAAKDSSDLGGAASSWDISVPLSWFVSALGVGFEIVAGGVDNSRDSLDVGAGCNKEMVFGRGAMAVVSATVFG